LTEPEPYKTARGSNVIVGRNSVSNDNVINTDNNGGKSVDKPGINNDSGIDNAGVNKDSGGINNNIGIDNTSVNKDNGGIDKSSINKPNNAQSNAAANNIKAKRAKFEEDVKREPILQTIMDVFDGELLG